MSTANALPALPIFLDGLTVTVPSLFLVTFILLDLTVVQSMVLYIAVSGSTDGVILTFALVEMLAISLEITWIESLSPTVPLCLSVVRFDATQLKLIVSILMNGCAYRSVAASSRFAVASSICSCVSAMFCIASSAAA